MITLTKYGNDYNQPVLSIELLSSETKPTVTYIEYDDDGVEVGRWKIPNGSVLTEIDTGTQYKYDSEGSQWYEVSSGGGGFTPTADQRTAMNSGITSDGVQQISSNETDIFTIQNNINDLTPIYFKLEKGGFNADGQTIDSNTRARSNGFIACNELIGIIHFPEGTKHRFVYYASNSGNYAGMTAWSTATEDTITFPTLTGTGYNVSFRILCGYQDDRTITNDNIPVIWFTYQKPKDNKIKALNGYQLSNYYSNSVGLNDNYRISPLIPVESGKSYKATKYRITVLYDADLKAIRALTTPEITNNTITINEGEAFICFCWRKTDTEEMYFAEADKFIGGTIIENLVSAPLTGKRLSLLGDSISAYTGTIPSGNDVYYTGNNSGVSDPSQMWWNILCEKTGMIPLVINGYSGSGITQLTDLDHQSKVPMSDTTRDQALHSGLVNPDVVIIAGGVNDYTYAEQTSQTPSGWDGTTAPVKGNSFDETYACMIKEIQTAYPNAMVVCLSTWFTMRGTDNGYTLVNGEGFTQADYDKAIENVAKIMRVPFINVDACGFNRSNFYPTYAQDSSTIPTHPNKAGHRVMGEYIAYNLPAIVKALIK